MLCVHAAQKRFAVKRARLAGLTASVQSLLQCLHPDFVLFQQPQPGSDHITGCAIAPALDLGINEFREVRPQGHGCVSAHGILQTMYQSIQNFDFLETGFGRAMPEPDIFEACESILSFRLLYMMERFFIHIASEYRNHDIN
jgi:hypothetical protein